MKRIIHFAVFVTVTRGYYDGSGSDLYSDDEDIHNYRNNPEVYKAFFEGIVDADELSGSGDYAELISKDPPIQEHSKNANYITSCKHRIVEIAEVEDLLEKSYLIAAVVAGIVGGIILSFTLISLTAYRIYKSNQGSYVVPLVDGINIVRICAFPAVLTTWSFYRANYLMLLTHKWIVIAYAYFDQLFSALKKLTTAGRRQKQVKR